MHTMKDVAKLAGVSLGSVSNVLNGVKVKPSTYKKVIDAVEELDYEKNNLARSFRMNHTNTIALIIPTIWHPFFSSIAFYVEQVAEENGFQVYMCNSDNNPEVELEYIELLRKSRVDGIIAITYANIDSYVESSLPFVSIDRHFSDEISIVSSDNFEGGRLAAKTLSEKNAKELLFVGSHHLIFNETMKRREGFEDYCKSNNIKYHIIDFLEPYTGLHEELENIFNENPNIDGIFAINDYLGMDIIKILSQFNRKVLTDYQLIGFDGLRTSRERDYMISSIEQPVRDIAYNAFNILLKMIENPDYNEQIKLPVQFQEGGTTRT